MWKYEGKNVRNDSLDDALDAGRFSGIYRTLSQSPVHIRKSLTPIRKKASLPHTMPAIPHYADILQSRSS